MKVTVTKTSCPEFPRRPEYSSRKLSEGDVVSAYSIARLQTEDGPSRHLDVFLKLLFKGE